MNGRQECDKKIYDRIERYLFDAPDIVIAYSKSFGDKTAHTKETYINVVNKFVCAV